MLVFSFIRLTDEKTASPLSLTQTRSIAETIRGFSPFNWLYQAPIVTTQGRYCFDNCHYL
ncbi:MAG: hypothetical protein MJB12_17875 [Firmicutes bacterium]|nr:hypothetical protein [Bacillota bacterium]